MSETTILTRRDLYDLVWTIPIVQLAQQFEISDGGLAAVCERHRVPRPGRGYWAKVEGGQKPKRAIFVQISDRTLDRIEIRPGAARLPEAARDILSKARVNRPEKTAAPSPPASQTVPKVEPIEAPHEAIRRTAQALRSGKPRSDGSVTASGEGMAGVTLGAANCERGIRILDLLARALEAASLPLQCIGTGMQVGDAKDRVKFTLSDTRRMVDHNPLEHELAAEAARQLKLSRMREPWSAPSALRARAYPAVDVIWTGQLSLVIENYGEGLRKTWADGKSQRVEACIQEIVTGLQAHLAHNRARREKNEADALAYKTLLHRRELAKQRIAREETRRQFLGDITVRHHELLRLETWLSSLDQESPSENLDFERFIEWTHRRIAALRQANTVTGLSEGLRKADLFPDPDRLHDPAGDPPAGGYW